MMIDDGDDDDDDDGDDGGRHHADNDVGGNVGHASMVACMWCGSAALATMMMMTMLPDPYCCDDNVALLACI